MAGSGSSEATPTAPLSSGIVLEGRYVIERLLGGGGMGRVYLGRDRRLANRLCALKEMVDHFIDPKQRLEANDYFKREADTLAQLRHPGIPQIIDRFDDHNRHYLVMEYVEGRNLEEELARNNGPLNEGLVIDVARQLCEVLSYLHSRNPPIIYRDLKPSNVMLTPAGRVVLIDFGIARLFRQARKGTNIGTLGFAPPEQYQGMLDPRSDIYALGATLHYLLTGRDPEQSPPFSFPPVAQLRAGLSPNLARAIDAALSYEIDRRPPTVRDFLDLTLYGRAGTAAEAQTGGSGAGPQGGTKPLARAARPAAAGRTRPRGSRIGMALKLLVLMLLLSGVAFAATYVYFNPQLQDNLGIRSWVENLPWKRRERLARAELRPLLLDNLSLALSTREGVLLSAPARTFLDTELARRHYLLWSASFRNEFADLAARTETVEARFFSPSGLQMASSAATEFIPASQKEAEFRAVALMPGLGDLVPGQYQVVLYAGDQIVGKQNFTVTADVAAERSAAEKAAAEAAAKAQALAAAKAAEEKKKGETVRLAMIEEARRHPLHLLSIRFENSTKSGTLLSGAATRFDANTVLFVNWEVSFENRLYNLASGEYRVDAAYVGPGGQTLGSVDDVQIAPASARTVTFRGRVGNSAGGAFLPGRYTVNFYLNGQFLVRRTFEVVAANAPAYNPGFSPATGAAAYGPRLSLSRPSVVTGKINGLGSRSSTPMEIRLKPEANGFLHGELVIHAAGYGPTPLEGFVRGDSVQFTVPYGDKTLFFEGHRVENRLTGTFEATPSGDRGSWETHTD